VDKLQTLTGVEYVCVILDRSKVKNQVTAFNSPSLDVKLPEVQKIFGESKT
jgi:hypothetical protein